MASVSYRGATRVYPESATPALADFDLDIADGEFMVLVGPSGSGKTTALRMLAGLEVVDRGRIHIGETEVTHARPQDRDIAMVFQSYALYPHMTVAQNISFHLRISGKPESFINEKVAEVAWLLELEPYLDRRPSKLSGGQRQRVAMARAIVRQPRVFLMDEPLSNLDAQLRVQTRTQIAALQRQFGTTTVYVTHDQIEAMTLGDRIAVIKDGRLQQCDRPRQVFDRPATTFVAGFLGSPAMNLIRTPMDGVRLRLGGMDIPTTARQRAALQSKEVTVGLRPDHLRVLGAGAPLVATVVAVEDHGTDHYLHLSAHLPGGDVPVVVRSDDHQPLRRGMRVGLGFDPRQTHLFDTFTGRRLPD